MVDLNPAFSGLTYIANSRCSLGDVVERAADVKQSHMESVQQGDTLLDHKHSRLTRPPLLLRQQPRRPLGSSPEPKLKAPPPRRHLPPAAGTAAFQLVLQTHQGFLEEVRNEGMAEDEEAASAPRGDPTFGGVHLDDAHILLSQSLKTCTERSH